jgi:hypothetical protein
MHDSVSISINLKSMTHYRLTISLYSVEIVSAGVKCLIEAIALPHHTSVIDLKISSMLSTLINLHHPRGDIENTRYTATT